jgi:hypothetical protein
VSKRWVRATFLLVASLLAAAGGMVADVRNTQCHAPEERPRPVSLQAFDKEFSTKRPGIG